MLNVILVKKISQIEIGNHAYIEGDVDEIKELCNAIGDFIVIPFGENTNKVTRVKLKEATKTDKLSNLLADYCGDDISVSMDVQYVRNFVSIYNKKNNTRFKVKNEDYKAKIYSEDINDFSRITQFNFEKMKEKFENILLIAESKLEEEDII